MKGMMTALAAVILLAGLAGCEKPPGKGGKATVQGRVYAYDFENTQRYMVAEGYPPGERVYICYGNTNEVSDDVRTSYDGSFEFRYLTKGHYKIFVNSLDTTTKGWKGVDTYKPVIVEFDITDPKQTLVLEDIKINI